MFKLAITTRPIEKGVSGSGMHLDRLLRAFVQINREFELFFLRTSDKPLWLDAHGTVVRLPRNPAMAAWRARRHSFDIVHYSPLSVLSPMGVRSRFRCATLHPDDELIIPEHYPWHRRAHARYGVGAQTLSMDMIFSVSKTSEALVAQTYGFDRKKIRLTMNAADPSFRPRPVEECAEVRRKYGLPGRFVLHISNFSARKNPWTLLRSFSEIVRSAPSQPCDFVLIGNGWATSPEVRAFLREEKLEERVKLPGFVPGEDIPPLLSAASVFVFPSLSEGFGMPNLEAMACGCPVITSDAFAIPEVVGDAAIVLRDKLDARELAGTILRVAGDEVLRADLRERGIRRARDFSWERSARNLLQGYRDLLAGEPGRRASRVFVPGW